MKNVKESWNQILNITSSYEQGASSQLKDDPYYREEVSTIETALKTLEIIKKEKEVILLQIKKMQRDLIDFAIYDKKGDVDLRTTYFLGYLDGRLEQLRKDVEGLDFE